jgi:hypothetical protein
MIRKRFLLSGLMLSCAVCLSATRASAADSASAPNSINYSRDIEPILADTCYHCHGPDGNQRKADLRLDQQDSTLAVHDHHVAIVPGDVHKSELVTRIRSSDPDEKMPPPKSNRSLTPRQIDLLEQWVAQGATWGKHWAYEMPRQAELPAVKDTAWCRNAIDRFVLARLEQEGLRPSPEASKEKLIRRVTFDLIGLPPTLEEIDAFVKDTNPDAYEKVVDRLLASPHYGERQAREWLDAARYADSNGFQEDRTRTMWPWRDWVVKAMNDNMPYDEFVVEQIAGDQMPNATMPQKLASGFNRNHMLNGEGGRIPEESRVDYVIDRVNTTSTVFLGLTLACTQCHDHKYDPFTQKEYYQLFSYFNNLPETGSVDAGGNAKPVMKLKSPDDEKSLAELSDKAKSAELALNDALPRINAAEPEWEKTYTPSATWTIAVPQSMKSANGATFTHLADGSVLVGGKSPVTDVHELTIHTDLTGIRSIRLEAIPDDSLPHGGPGRSPDTGNFVLTKFEADAVSAVKPDELKKVAFASSEATYSQQGFDPNAAIGKDSKPGWAIFKAPDRKNLSAIFTAAEPIGFPGGTELRLRFNYESKANKEHTMGRFRLSLTTGVPTPDAVTEALAVDRADRTPKQKAAINAFFRTHYSDEFKTLSDAATAAKEKTAEYEKTLPEVMVMEDMPKPRDTHVLIRGSWDKPGPSVTPGVPAMLHPMPSDAPNNRLGLARWIVDPSNPLTARVTVNRYWQSFFGIGIVKTPEDFGVQGEKPSHPKLLDWLAVEFLQHGWNVKAIHRLIVTSATYRQSSHETPELIDRDPDNRLLARGPRHRLSAFELRDQALAVSGLLVDRVGGPPVFPYQPPNLWEEFSFGKIKYVQDHGDKLYRRSLYTYWRRTVQPTMMFDTASRQVCTVRRSLTNTPLQSLILMNETGYVEAARVLAQKLLEEKEATNASRIVEAFRRCTGRAPADHELTILTETLRRLQSQYAAAKADATKLINTGESPLNEKLNAQDLAAYTTLVNAIMNLDETLTNG